MEAINYSLEPREDILKVIPQNAIGNVLDVGCATGVLGKALKEKGAKRVVGIEINQLLANEARKNIDEVHCCNLENYAPLFKNKEFDLIICADVIEHLARPEVFLAQYLPFVKVGGYLVASIPNVQYYFVIWSLLQGEWKYCDRGIFDRTHLRFFTLKSIKRFFHACGLEIVNIERNYRLREQYCSHPRLAQFLSVGMLKNFFTFQYVILARKRT